MTRITLLLCVLFIAGCGPKPVPPKVIIEKIVETVEVKIPVTVARVPPAELIAPLHPELPMFTAPTDPEASSALTAEGERLLRALLEELLTRIAAWQAWATEEGK